MRFLCLFSYIIIDVQDSIFPQALRHAYPSIYICIYIYMYMYIYEVLDFQVTPSAFRCARSLRCCIPDAFPSNLGYRILRHLPTAFAYVYL